MSRAKVKVTKSFKQELAIRGLDEKLNVKSEKLFKLFPSDKIQVNWLCDFKQGHHHFDIKLIGPHFEYHASAHAENAVTALDQVYAKIEKQLKKKKSKWNNHKGGTGVKKLPETIDPHRDEDDDDYSDVA